MNTEYGRGEVDPLLEIDLSNRTGFKALGKRKTAPSPTARRATEEGRRRNLIQQASAQGFSKGGVIKKSKTRKKSNIDGIARRGHTRAPHK